MITRKWASVRDLDDLFSKFGKEEGGKKVIDLVTAGYDKPLVAVIYQIHTPSKYHDLLQQQKRK